MGSSCLAKDPYPALGAFMHTPVWDVAGCLKSAAWTLCHRNDRPVACADVGIGLTLVPLVVPSDSVVGVERMLFLAGAC